MNVQIAALCDSAADYSGKLCVMGVFDTIAARQFPIVHAYCSLALRVVFSHEEEGAHKLRVTLIDEDGRALLPALEPEINISLPENMFFATSNFVFNLQGLKFEKAGQYSFDIAVDGKMIARVPMQVVLMTGAA